MVPAYFSGTRNESARPDGGHLQVRRADRRPQSPRSSASAKTELPLLLAAHYADRRRGHCNSSADYQAVDELESTSTPQLLFMLTLPLDVSALDALGFITYMQFGPLPWCDRPRRHGNRARSQHPKKICRLRLGSRSPRHSRAFAVFGPVIGGF